MSLFNPAQGPGVRVDSGIEGNSVILSSYEGLLTYAPNSTQKVGALATSWSTAPDRLTYTFHLRSGVHFHDGDPWIQGESRVITADSMRTGCTAGAMTANNT